MDIAQWEIAYVPTTGVRQAHETPIVVATDASLMGYGCLVEDPKTFPIEIVRWPAKGWRPVWHGAVVPLDDEAEFLDRQGRVHARVSVDFVKEFGCYLAAPMLRPQASRA